MKYVFIIFGWMLLFLSAQIATAQLVNNGATIKLSAGTTLATPNDITNQNGGQITNNGRLTTKADINNDANSSIGGDGDYEVAGSWMNNGTYDSGTSTVTIGGANGNCMVASNAAQFYHLQIDCIDNGEVQLMDDLNVTNELEMSGVNNKIRIGNHDLKLINASQTGFSDTRFIITDGTGTVERQVGNGTAYFYIGSDANNYHPIFLAQELDGNGDNIPTIDMKVRCFPNILDGGSSGDPLTENAVNKMWEITSNTAFEVGANFEWAAEDELDGFNRAQASVAHYANGQWNLGTAQGATTLPNNDLFLQANSFTQPGVYGLMSSAPLPLELLAFTAQTFQQQHALLNWQTGVEQAVSHFAIERSTDGQNWQYVDKIIAKGSQQSYRYVDQKIADLSSGLYYRLKMIDINGDFAYSPIRTIQFEPKNSVATTLEISPNPFRHQTQLTISLPHEYQIATLQVTNPLGQIVKQIVLNNSSRNIVTLTMDRFATGIYQCSLIADGQVLLTKSIIQTQ